MTSEIRATTQEHLDIEAIRDGFVILKDGGVLSVLATTAVNFDLLSEREQEAMIESYGGFLNSLSFTVQLLVRSKRLDISSYLDLLKKEEESQPDAKLREHIKSYYDFVKNLIVKNQVLDKKFYLAISQYEMTLAIENPTMRIWNQLRGKPAPRPTVQPEKLVEVAKPKLEPKVEHVIKQLARIGIQARRLSTGQLVQLFHEIYNYGD